MRTPEQAEALRKFLEIKRDPNDHDVKEKGRNHVQILIYAWSSPDLDEADIEADLEIEWNMVKTSRYSRDLEPEFSDATLSYDGQRVKLTEKEASAVFGFDWDSFVERTDYDYQDTKEYGWTRDRI